MAVLWARKMWDSREGSDGDEGVRTYTQMWRVKTNNKNDDAATVLASTGAGIPYRGLIHPTDGAAYCRSVRARNEGASPYFWTVTASYSTEREVNDSPLDDAPEISWNGEQYQEVVVKDTNGEPVLNSAGDAFDPPVLRDRTRLTCDIKFNLAVVPAFLLSYKDAINDSAIVIDGLAVAARVAKCGIVTVGPVRERNDITYREVTASFSLNVNTWRESVLDQGFRVKDTTDPLKRNQATNDGDNAEPTVPILLDGFGEALADPSVSNAVFLDFDLYDELDFTIFPGITAGA